MATKEEIAARLNRAFGAEVDWQKLSKDELAQLDMIMSNPVMVVQGLMQVMSEDQLQQLAKILGGGRPAEEVTVAFKTKIFPTIDEIISNRPLVKRLVTAGRGFLDDGGGLLGLLTPQSDGGTPQSDSGSDS